MNSRFSWFPLIPPDSGTQNPKNASILADWGAVIFLGLGILQVMLGLEDGPLRFAALALGIVLFGLPHGAIDHLVALGLADRPLRLVPLAMTVCLYLLAVCSVLIMWFFLPVLTASGFLVMTIYHWGKSDLTFERYVLFESPEFRGPLASFNHSMSRGMIPICVPFFAFPDQSTEFLAACIGLFSPDRSVSFQELGNWVVLVLCLSFLVDQWIHLRKIRLLAARRIFIENILLVSFFWVVPPLLAVGWYFSGWHGLRHIIRLCHYERKGVKPISAVTGKIRTFAVQALPFTLISILMLMGLLGGLADRIPSAYEGVALYLVLISALTFPHVIIVEWMDHREGQTWRNSRRRSFNRKPAPEESSDA